LIDNPSYQYFATHDESAYPELWDGCVGAWAPCLGTSGLRLHDNSGRQNWGTLTNMDAASDWVVDGGRYALNFDGSNNRVITLLGGSAVGGRNALTMGFWGKRRASLSPVSFGCDVSGVGYINIVANVDGNLYFQAVPNFPAVASNLTTWAHYAMRLTPSKIEGFIDGIKVVDGTGPAVVPTVNSTFAIGFYGFSGAQFSNGLIDDAFVTTKAVSDDEMFTLYRIGRGGMYKPRRRRRIYSLGPTFNAAWARDSNVILQPSVGVA